MQEQVDDLLLSHKDDSRMKVDYHFQLNSQTNELEMESTCLGISDRDWHHELTNAA